MGWLGQWISVGYVVTVGVTQMDMHDVGVGDWVAAGAGIAVAKLVDSQEMKLALEAGIWGGGGQAYTRKIQH